MSDERDEGASRPRQVEGLEVTEVADGLVIYQPRPEQVHHLNRTAAVVFELCTGEHSPEDIARLLGDAFTLGTSPSEEVRRCLEQLGSLGLVQ